MNHFFNVNHVSNLAWLMLDNLVKVVVSFTVTIYVIRYLGPADFGLLSYALSIVGILYPIATLGIDAILFRNIIKDKSNERTLIKTAYTVRLFAALPLFLITSTVVYLYSEDMIFVYMLMILSAGMIVDVFSVYKEYFAANTQNKYIAISSSTSNILSSGIKILFIFTKLSVVWFAFAFVFQKIFNILSLKYFYKKKSASNTGSYDRNIAKEMVKDSWPLIFTSFSGLLYLYADQILIEYYLGVEQVGLYAAATKLIIFFYVIPTILSNVIYPKVIELKQTMGSREFSLKIEMVYFINFMIALFILIFFLVFGERLVLFLFGKEFLGSSDVLLIYAFSLVLVFFAANNNKLLMMDNLQKMMLGRNVFGLIVNIILNVMLIPEYGIKGAAIATVLTQVMIMFSYGINRKTRYILWIQLKAMIYPVVLLARRVL
jgi:O-antigen/teichoic acid export membrane protein